MYRKVLLTIINNVIQQVCRTLSSQMAETLYVNSDRFPLLSAPGKQHLLSASMSLTGLVTSYKWNPVVFVFQ